MRRPRSRIEGLPHACSSPPSPVLAHRIAHRIASEDASRPLWRHPATIAAAALALTLGAVPLLPDGDDQQGEIAPSAETHAGARQRGRHAAR